MISNGKIDEVILGKIYGVVVYNVRGGLMMLLMNEL